MLLEIDTTAAAGTAFRASLFGCFTLFGADGLPIPISSSRVRGVLAMACLAPDEALQREHLSKLLWPGRFQAQARASLRQTLLQLDRVLVPHGRKLLETSRAAIMVDGACVTSDLDALMAALRARRIAEACALLAEIGSKPLLDQMDFGEPFQAWLEGQRWRVERRLQASVAQALADLAGDSDSHMQLREAWLASGRAELGRAELGRAESQGEGAPRRIAVLPFEQRDAFGGPLFLADAVVDELVARLGSVSALAVVGRASVAAIAGRGLTIGAMASALGVSHIIEGTVERFAGGISVIMRLVDGQTDSLIWSHRYDGTLDAAMQSRQHIGADILVGLCGALGLDGHVRPARTMTANREAYALYLQGRALTYRAIGDGVLETAIELLERALALDPDFAECWTALAEAHVNTAVFTPCLDRVERSARMAACAERALVLDAEQGHAHAMRGIHEWTLGNPAGALDHAFEAYRLEPGNADVAARLGSFLLYIGRSRAALPYIEQAIELDPVYPRNLGMLCAAHFNLGDYEAALAAGQRMVDLGFPGMWLAVTEAAMGQNEQAVATYYRQRLLMNTVILPPAGMAPMSEEARDAYWGMAARGVCSGAEDDRALYCQLLDGLHATMLDGCDPSIAFPAIWMGHSDLVMKLYRQQIHPANMFGLMSLWTEVEPICRTRLHPGFMAFAEDIGLVKAWERHGWPDLMPSDPRI